MELAVLLHDPIEPPGMIADLLDSRGQRHEIHRLYEEGLPAGLDRAGLVLMGGPMSVNDQDRYPWLEDEQALIRDAVGDGRPVLGVCLGAQLIARALGARVYPSVPEHGWRTLSGVAGNPLFPREFSAFELHGETFDLPPGAALLATGDAVRHQAFAVGSALGLQFHLEATPDVIAAWTADLPAADRETCAALTVRQLPAARRLLGGVLDYLLRE